MKPHALTKAQAADACVARFQGRALAWGRVDCAQIVLHNLRKQGISTAAWKGLRYSTELGAAKALREFGFTGLIPAMDAFGLLPIGAASAAAGDIVAIRADSNLWDCSLHVRVSPQHFLGIHPETGTVLAMELDLSHSVAAWRCTPCRR